MKNIKAKILTFSIILAICLSFSIPVFASSSSYNFSMNYRNVNGKENGQFHQLTKGVPVKIYGSTTIVNSSDPSFPKYDIYYSLVRDVFGFDKKYGSVNGGVGRSFSGTFSGKPDVTSGDYYLIIWKTEDDGHDVEGDGTIYN